MSRIEHYGICGRIDVTDIIANIPYADNERTEKTKKGQMPVYQEK